MLPRRHLGPPPLVRPTPGRLDLGPGRNPPGDPEQPTGQRVAPADRTGPPGEHQERHLGGVLSIVRVVEHIVADAEDHRAVPFDQGRERDLGDPAAPGDVPLQQLGVGHPDERADLEKRPEISQAGIRTTGRHGTHSQSHRTSYSAFKGSKLLDNSGVRSPAPSPGLP